jgi:hypothetical protein
MYHRRHNFSEIGSLACLQVRELQCFSDDRRGAPSATTPVKEFCAFPFSGGWINHE